MDYHDLREYRNWIENHLNNLSEESVDLEIILLYKYRDLTHKMEEFKKNFLAGCEKI